MNLQNRLMTIGYSQNEAMVVIQDYERKGELQNLIEYCNAKVYLLNKENIDDYKTNYDS